MEQKIRIETDKAPASTGYRSNAIRAAGLVFTGGHIGAPISSAEQRIGPAATLEEQIELCLEHMEQLVLAGGATKEGIVEVSAFLVPIERQSIVRQHVKKFLGFMPPLFHVQAVSDVAMHAMLEMDGIAIADPQLAKAQAVNILRPFGKEQGLVCSGPFVMINGLTAPGENLGEQTTNLLIAAERQLREVGSALSDLIKMTVYIADYDAYPQFNEATKRAFATFIPPTRSVLVAPKVTGDSLLRVDLLTLAGVEQTDAE